MLLVAGLLALAFNLRAAITSLPPVFPELQTALHLPSAAIAALAAVPVLCFGVFAPVAAPASRWFGEERVLLAALLLLAAGLLARGALPGALLFPGTVVAAGAIALMNVLLPSLVKRRRPEQAGLLIGTYLLSMSAGSVIASFIAVPVYQSSGGSIPLTLGLWALPALAAALVWLPQWRFHTVPGKSSDPGSAPRASSPAASRSSAASSTRSSPNRRLAGAATGENTPKQSTGTAASAAIAPDGRCRADCSSGKTGGRLVIAARRLNASASRPATSSTGASLRRPVRSVTGAGGAAGSDISGHVTASPLLSCVQLASSERKTYCMIPPCR